MKELYKKFSSQARAAVRRADYRAMESVVRMRLMAQCGHYSEWPAVRAAIDAAELSVLRTDGWAAYVEKTGGHALATKLRELDTYGHVARMCTIDW